MVTQATAAIDEVDRLAHRIERVLALARTDSGAVRTDLIDTTTVIGQRVSQAQLVAEERGIDMRIHLEPDLMVTTSATALAGLVDELLGNALTYARTSITVELHSRDDTVALTVGDDGPGVSAFELEEIFQRFTRGSGAVPGGSGLGLALVQETARAYGGDAYATTSADGGLAVCVVLPRS